ncbi:MAG TPA: response regulator transcription factor [Candidatus Eremiobacteraceae bacterium]|nr:response regulator transcription factor [Candidatus Eremiobacteraceae bacterium]
MAHNILIVDDNALLRRMLRTCLQQDPQWNVCGEAENGKQAVEKVAELKPDVVLLDMQMPLMNGLEAARRIRAIAPKTAMLMFTMHASAELLHEAQAAGIGNVVSKTDQLVEHLFPALRKACA